MAMADTLKEALIGAVAGNIGNGGDRQLVQQTFDTFNRQQQAELDTADTDNVARIVKLLEETESPIAQKAYEKLLTRIIERGN